jgi:hypothetical protein
MEKAKGSWLLILKCVHHSRSQQVCCCPNVGILPGKLHCQYISLKLGRYLSTVFLSRLPHTMLLLWKLFFSLFSCTHRYIYPYAFRFFFIIFIIFALVSFLFTFLSYVLHFLYFSPKWYIWRGWGGDRAYFHAWMPLDIYRILILIIFNFTVFPCANANIARNI